MIAPLRFVVHTGAHPEISAAAMISPKAITEHVAEHSSAEQRESAAT